MSHTPHVMQAYRAATCRDCWPSIAARASDAGWHKFVGMCLGQSLVRRRRLSLHAIRGVPLLSLPENAASSRRPLWVACWGRIARGRSRCAVLPGVEATREISGGTLTRARTPLQSHCDGPASGSQARRATAYKTSLRSRSSSGVSFSKRASTRSRQVAWAGPGSRFSRRAGVPAPRCNARRAETVH